MIRRSLVVVALALVLTACSSTTTTFTPVANPVALTSFNVSVTVNSVPSGSVSGITVKATPQEASSPSVTTSGPCGNTGCSLTAQSAVGYVTAQITLTGATGPILDGTLRLNARSGGRASYSVAFGGTPTTMLLSVEPAYVTIGRPETRSV